MNKVIWSAFALSLCLISMPGWSQTDEMDNFLGLEVDEILLENKTGQENLLDVKSELKPELKGKQQFSPADLHDKVEWNVEEKQVEIDTQSLKGQGYSLIPWATQDPQDWLSVDRWLAERATKDKIPDWKIRLRDNLQTELVGKILQCYGQCDVYRGSMKAKVQHLSHIIEGDELKTDVDTVAWIYLMDGTLVRLGPSSSLAFLETNWSKNEVFHLVRLNQGHLYWHPRDSQEYPLELGPETDRISLPLLVREANQENFERAIFKTQNDFQQSQETLKLEDTAILAQIKKINDIKNSNNSIPLPPSRVMMVAPNASVVGKKTTFDFFYYPGGKSHFKKRNSLEGHELVLHLRGYSATELNPITENAWYDIEASGRSFSKVEDVSGALEITELLTRRIKTIELAREMWLEKFSLPIAKSLNDSKELAIQHGLVLWGDELNKRFDFLVEYTRRMETTNLKSIDNLLVKVQGEGKVEPKEISDSHYKATLKSYMMNLKTRYTKNQTQVREMNDLQYYIWILRHEKRKN